MKDCILSLSSFGSHSILIFQNPKQCFFVKRTGEHPTSQHSILALRVSTKKTIGKHQERDGAEYRRGEIAAM